MKKRNPFKKWQKDNVERRIIYIQDELSTLNSSDAKFKSLNSLANAISKMVSQRESLEAAKNKLEIPKPLSKTTLLRNSEYKLLLLQYLGGHFKDNESLNEVESSISDPSIRALMETKNLEISNLKEEASRLKSYLESIELDRYKNKNLDNTTKNITITNNSEHELELLSKAILNITSELSWLIKIDLDKEIIIRKDLLTKNILASKELMKGFFRVIDTRNIGIDKNNFNE